MKAAAAVAHEQPAGGISKQFAERRDAVLERHVTWQIQIPPNRGDVGFEVKNGAAFTIAAAAPAHLSQCRAAGAACRPAAPLSRAGSPARSRTPALAACRAAGP